MAAQIATAGAGFKGKWEATFWARGKSLIFGDNGF
jgi:hypothetical protein